MSERIYLLMHIYLYGENDECEEKKLIGIYSSRENAEETISQYLNLPGFCEYSRDCFKIDKFVINEDKWTKGFIEISATKDVPVM